MATTYSLKDRLEAAMAYLVTGFNAAKAAKICGIPERTVREWTDTDWWPDVMAKAKLEKQAELDSNMTEIIHKAASRVRERLEQGDPFVTKDGTVQFKPVTAKDATMVTAIMADKRALIRGEPTRRTQQVKESDRLEDIKKQLLGPQEASQEVSEDSKTGLENFH